MNANLQRPDHRAPRKTSSITALWVGFGVALGAAGMQLLPVAHNAPPSLHAMASAAPARVDPAGQAEQRAPRERAVVDQNDLETVQQSIGNYDR